MKQGWEIKTIADVCTFIKNGANIKQERGAGGVPITRIETLSGGVFNRDRLGYANLATPDKYLSYVLEYGDLLFSHINSKTYIGRTVVYVPENDEQVIHGMNLLRLKLDFDLMSPFFFQYYTRTDIFKAQVANRRKDAVNQSSITTTDIKTILLPVPPIAEQEKIVAELDCLSGIIEKKKQQLKELENLAQSIFYEMFGDPVENDKGWETAKLKDSVIEMFLGPFGSALKTECYVDKDASYCMVYEQKHAIRKTLNLETHYINQSKYNELKRFEVHSGDFIMSCRGTIGEIYRLPDDAPMGIIHPSVMKIRIKEEVYNPIFFNKLLSRIIKNETTNGNCVQMAITAKELGARKPILPPLKIQQGFASKIEVIEKQKELIAQSIKETETLFNSRMDYYFN